MSNQGDSQSKSVYFKKFSKFTIAPMHRGLRVHRGLREHSLKLKFVIQKSQILFLKKCYTKTKYEHKAFRIKF